MATQIERAAKAEVLRLATVACCQYSNPNDYHKAMSRLKELSELTDNIVERARLGRFLRWKAMCNTVVSQKVREYRYRWLGLSAQRETEDRFEEWLMGKPIGVLQDGMLVIDSAGEMMPVMDRTQAEWMEFQTLGGRFRLACDTKAGVMIVSTFQC